MTSRGQPSREQRATEDHARPPEWPIGSEGAPASMRFSRVSEVGPDFGAVGGASDLRVIVGALLTYGVIVAVLMLIVSATTWALASGSGSWHVAQKAKVGCFVALGGAALTGSALAWANWLLGVGAHL